MSYRVTVIADFNGKMYIGADKRPIALAAAAPIAEVKLFSSQLPFAVSARRPDGAVVITTRNKAKRNGWATLFDAENNPVSIKAKEKPKKRFHSLDMESLKHTLGMADGIEMCANQLPDSLSLVRDGWLNDAKAMRNIAAIASIKRPGD
jgi:hypothetical protein